MTIRKFLHLSFFLLIAASIIIGGSLQVQANSLAAPAGPTDESKVPHYYGPWPNWATSPLTLPDAYVVITGNGSGAEAVASVGADGAVTGITVTNGGSGYSNAKVDIIGSGTGAEAKATIIKKGAVVAVTVNTFGSGYTAPFVSFSGGGSGGGAERDRLRPRRPGHGHRRGRRVYLPDGGFRPARPARRRAGPGPRRDGRQRHHHGRYRGQPRVRLLACAGRRHPQRHPVRPGRA